MLKALIARFVSRQWIGEPKQAADTFSPLRAARRAVWTGAKQLVLKHDPNVWEGLPRRR